MVRTSLIIVLPFLLLFSILFSLFVGQVFTSLSRGYFTPSTFGITLAFILLAVLLSIIVPSLIITIMQLYNERDNGLQGLKFRDVFAALKDNFSRAAWIVVIACLLSFVLFWIAADINLIIVLVVVFVLFLFVGVPLLLLFPTFLLGKSNLIKSIGESFRLGYKTWGSTFSSWLILKIIQSFISLFFAFPWLILTYVEYTFFSESDTFSISFGYQLLIFILSALMIAGNIIASVPLYVGLCYQYAQAVSHKENKLVVDNIEEAEQSFKIIREDK